MNIAIISGSARANNNTIRVGKALQQRMQGAGHHVSLIDFQHYDIPLINQGEVGHAHFTPFQQELANAMQHAHTIIIITPEYNWSTTPEILNFLHRFGDRQFKDLFEHKVFATVGVSTGREARFPRFISMPFSIKLSASPISLPLYRPKFLNRILPRKCLTKQECRWEMMCTMQGWMILLTTHYALPKSGTGNFSMR
jgi:multimeric flavodoxin WrbA